MKMNFNKGTMMEDKKETSVDNPMGGSQPPLSLSDEVIITFYSDRNLNRKMEFKNPKVRHHYEITKSIKEQNIPTKSRNR